MRAPHSMRERPDAILPSKKDAELATESSRILSALKGDGAFRVQLEGGQELVLPSAVKTLLMHLLTEMSRGNAVTIIPIHAELTTQEAADVLNVSRPYLIGLLEKGELPHHMVGTHRRVKFEDISAYRKKENSSAKKQWTNLPSRLRKWAWGTDCLATPSSTMRAFCIQRLYATFSFNSHPRTCSARNGQNRYRTNGPEIFGRTDLILIRKPWIARKS